MHKFAGYCRSLAAAAALAVAAAAPPAAAVPRGPARQHVTAAARAYDVGDFGTAADHYKAAYALAPDPALLYQIAECTRSAGDAAGAADYYRRYLRDAPDGARRGEAEGRLAELDVAGRRGPLHPPALSGDARMTTTPSGLQYTDEKVGTGTQPKAGQKVRVHYTGWLKNGKKFDSSLDRGRPFEFVLGARQVIKGWDEGVATMHVGGKRRLVIPADLAYGNRDVGNGLIPPNSELTFDVELLGLAGEE